MTSLSERQHQVVSGLANGMTVKELARWLGISPRTVMYHIGKARRKLGATTREEMVARAVSAGLVQVGMQVDARIEVKL